MVVMIDSLTGYFHAMPQEDALLTQLHELRAFLSQNGVRSLLTMSQHGMLGESIKRPLEASYLADTVVVLPHFEAADRVRKAISVLEKRHGHTRRRSANRRWHGMPRSPATFWIRRRSHASPVVASPSSTKAVSKIWVDSF